MQHAVIVATTRTPFGRRDGVLSGLKAVELLRHVQLDVLDRAGIEPGEVDQLIGGCVTQSGEQSLNVTRNAWLNTGRDFGVPGTTVDASCGSSTQAAHMAAALVTAGAAQVVVSCGVESMSRVPIGTNLYQGPGHYKAADYPWDDPPKAQFGGAERIAEREGLTREELDAYGARAQQRAQKAWDEGRFDGEISPIKAPDPQGGTVIVNRDEGLRPTTVDTLAELSPTIAGGLHTAGTTSQMSDGAAAILWMSPDAARAHGLRPQARIRHQRIVGADPFYLLDGPLAATEAVFARSDLSVADMDLVEVNEAFAGVVLTWIRHHRFDPELVNVNGGAIALGHPLGATGTRLISTAVAELERRDGQFALITMCCGGSLGTATVVERL